MSQGCSVPPPVTAAPPAPAAADPRGPAQHASPRAHEAFGEHLDRELEPRDPRARPGHCGPQEAVPMPALAAASAPPPPAAPRACAPVVLATGPELAPAGAAAQDTAVAVVAVPALPTAEATPDLAAVPAAVAATVSPAPVASAAVPSPQAGAPGVSPSPTGTQVPASTTPSGAQSGPALPEADPLCAPDGVAIAATPAIPATPARPAQPPAAAAPPTDVPAGVATDQPSSDEPRHERPDRQPGPPPTAAAWQHASAPAHSSSPLAANVPLDPGMQATQPTAPAGTAPTAAAPPPEPRGGVRLIHAAETLRLTISAANAQGISRARIVLKPAELGGIEIVLAHGPSGLSATVTADSAQAAHALQRAADELQRTLTEQGLSLVRLEINVAGEGAQERGREDRVPAADDNGANSDHAPVGDATDDDRSARTLELPNGALVDVLA